MHLQQPIIHPKPLLVEIKKFPSTVSQGNTVSIYALRRYNFSDEKNNKCPPWCPFHIACFFTINTPLSTVCYNIIMMAQPTDCSNIIYSNKNE